MTFDDAIKNKAAIQDALTRELREHFRRPALRVSISVIVDDAGHADYSIVVCDAVTPDRVAFTDLIFAAKRKMMELCPSSLPQVRAISIEQLLKICTAESICD